MKRKGSITVFAALSFMLIAQMLFTLLEVARYHEFEKVLPMNSDSVLESVFADYCSPLWEEYRILGVCAEDAAGNFSFNQREAEMRNLTAYNLGSRGKNPLSSGMSLLTAEMTDIEFTPYRLMTDQNGKAFSQVVCAYMKKNMAYEMAKSVYNNYESVKEVSKDCADTDESINEAMDALKHPEKFDEQGAGSTSSGNLKSTSAEKRKSARKGAAVKSESGAGDSKEENLLTTVAEIKKKGVLSLVLPENAQVSDKTVDLADTVSHRKLETGTMKPVTNEDWYEQVLFNQYLINYLSSYTNPGENRGLSYEIEYVLGGKAEDSENLKIVVGELLTLREPLNLASLAASPEKQEEAMTLALALAGMSANPLVIEAVKYGILAAWAFAESVLDVRTLLSGGKISLIKSSVDWTSNVNALPELLSGWSVAKDCPQGLDYGQYLAMLLLFHGETELAMRTMDIQEAAIRKQEGYEHFRMDHVLCETKIVAAYEFKPVFLGFVSLLGARGDRFCIRTNSEYSYIKGKEEV
ncbi:MAG: DUF5702 domain-containing protein [Lachnospiraceae bacterium]|nr:DUF5702 domain-containing protein [Agathobacter sp.]MDD6444694.1 DUF5702 domain-containing protein [Lachnospiraceae bacterium]MDY4894060.1 DUF5702 domain-containing protein [Agathobacter sp.]